MPRVKTAAEKITDKILLERRARASGVDVLALTDFWAHEESIRSQHQQLRQQSVASLATAATTTTIDETAPSQQQQSVMTTSLIDLSSTRPVGIQRRLSLTLETQPAQTRGPLYSLTPPEQQQQQHSGGSHQPSAMRLPPLHTTQSQGARAVQFTDVVEDPSEAPAVRQQLPAINNTSVYMTTSDAGEPEDGEGAVAALLDDSGDDSDSESDIADEESESAPAEVPLLAVPHEAEGGERAAAAAAAAATARRPLGSFSLGPASRFSMGSVKYSYPLPVSDHYTAAEVRGDLHAAQFRARIAELNRLEKLAIRKEPWAFAAWKRLTGRRSHPNEL